MTATIMMISLTERISEFAQWFLGLVGYPGAALLMALESMIAPVPSEAVMPFVGFQVAEGKWSLWLAIAATSFGSIVGSAISYGVGYYGGEPAVRRVGRYLLLDEHDLELTKKFFHRGGGAMTIFFSRFVPVVRHLISIPAGVGRMPALPFFAATLIGATIWNSFLLFCGMKLKQNWEKVQAVSHWVDLVVVLALAAALAWFIHGRLKRRRLNAQERL